MDAFSDSMDMEYGQLDSNIWITDRRSGIDSECVLENPSVCPEDIVSYL